MSSCSRADVEIQHRDVACRVVRETAYPNVALELQRLVRWHGVVVSFRFAKSKPRLLSEGVFMPFGPFSSSVGVGRAEPEWVGCTLTNVLVFRIPFL